MRVFQTNIWLRPVAPSADESRQRLRMLWRMWRSGEMEKRRTQERRQRRSGSQQPSDRVRRRSGRSDNLSSRRSHDAAHQPFARAALAATSQENCIASAIFYALPGTGSLLGRSTAADNCWEGRPLPAPGRVNDRQTSCACAVRMQLRAFWLCV